MISGDFDRLAGIYDWLAWRVYGSAIRKAQTCFLHTIPDNSRVLVLGGGTGWWLPYLLEEKKNIQLLYVDPSEQMIRRARKHSGSLSAIEFIPGTIEAVPDSRKFDAVITFFFFDLFEGEVLEDQMNLIREHLDSETIWLVADFTDKQIWHRMLLGIMYGFFRLFAGLKTKRLPSWEESFSRYVIVQHSARFYGSFIRSLSGKLKSYQPMP